MHPPLKTGHEKCRKQIDDLERCHKENPFAKFVGVCNSVRVALDKCLYAEYLELRQQNFERHREHREQADQMLRKKFDPVYKMRRQANQPRKENLQLIFAWIQWCFRLHNRMN
ncbi:Respiratory chain complex assembly or maintenance protein [Balamuthia mandrillaris]